MSQTKDIFEQTDAGSSPAQAVTPGQSGDPKEVEDLRRALDECRFKADILHEIPTPVMAVDREYRVIYMNAAGAKALGKSADAVVGQYCFNLFNTGHCNTENCQVKKAMQQDGVFTSDTVARLPSGELPIRYTGKPIKNDKG
ncbi:PAS domain-containing protein, partial [Desulfonatronospira sp.]|uniref:PAS domain-containing protein n=1 Tax=Desulfonatronospira sp. TaxID=1962951 RepID=UPI0025C47A37